MPLEEERDTAAQLINILPCAHVNGSRTQVAGREVLSEFRTTQHTAVQRVLTLRPSGPAEPYL